MIIPVAPSLSSSTFSAISISISSTVGRLGEFVQQLVAQIHGQGIPRQKSAYT